MRPSRVRWRRFNLWTLQDYNLSGRWKGPMIRSVLFTERRRKAEEWNRKQTRKLSLFTGNPGEKFHFAPQEAAASRSRLIKQQKQDRLDGTVAQHCHLKPLQPHMLYLEGSVWFLVLHVLHEAVRSWLRDAGRWTAGTGVLWSAASGAVTATPPWSRSSPSLRFTPSFSILLSAIYQRNET